MLPKDATYVGTGTSAPNLSLAQQTGTYDGSFALKRAPLHVCRIRYASLGRNLEGEKSPMRFFDRIGGNDAGVVDVTGRRDTSA